jgi:hypothetical protein
MAKFTNKDLRLKDGEKLTLGTDLDANVWYDGVANQLAVDVTVSGITPTQDYHLTTKQYVDEVASTLSGSMVMDHGGLLGLGDDDHTQYVLADGTRAFSGTVGGVNPTEPTHLTTKQYVDSVAQGLDWQDSVFDFFDPTSGLPATPSVGNRYIATVTANGWTANSIYEWDGTLWVETTSNEGVATWNELKYKCTVVKHYADNLPPVRCLPSQLNQVFMNLLVNAAHAIETKGEITLSTRRVDDNTIQLRFTDNGQGIPAEHLKRIFEPFFTTKPVGKGTGLGLSIAWGIIGKHHGKIEVSSTVGSGTTFIITLPVHGPDEPVNIPAAVSPAPTFKPS